MDEQKVNRTLNKAVASSAGMGNSHMMPLPSARATTSNPVGSNGTGGSGTVAATPAATSAAAPATTPSTDPATAPAVSPTANADAIRAHWNQYAGTNSSTVTTTDTTTSAADAAGAAGAGTPSYAYNDPDRAAAINRMYDANLNAQKTALQEAGDQALSDAQANRDRIADNYQTAMNQSAVNWERMRRNFLEGANMSGVNTGANSQAQLHMMGEQNRAQGNLAGQQAAATGEADRNIADIRRSTQAGINEAIAKNDYQRAAALLDEYNTMYNRAITRAETLSKYGDFSGYAAIYGDEEAQRMAYNWYAQDPNLAYMMGSITADQRDNLMHNLPINDGLDENGVRVAPLRSSGGGGNQRSTADILRDQAWSMANGTNGSLKGGGINTPGNWTAADAADYSTHLRM